MCLNLYFSHGGIKFILFALDGPEGLYVTFFSNIVMLCKRIIVDIAKTPLVLAYPLASSTLFPGEKQFLGERFLSSCFMYNNAF